MRVRVLLGCELWVTCLFKWNDTVSLFFFCAYFFALLPVCLSARDRPCRRRKICGHLENPWALKRKVNTTTTTTTNVHGIQIAWLPQRAGTRGERCTNNQRCNPLMLFFMNVMRNRRRRVRTDCFLRNSNYSSLFHLNIDMNIDAIIMSFFFF